MDLKGRDIQLLGEARSLAGKIQRKWNLLAPPELADEIIALEDRVAQITGSSLEVEKIRKLANLLHFQFVFPVALDVMVSFKRAVEKVAREVWQTGSLYAFLHEFNGIQQNETLRYAVMGGAA